jgi:hypothetical protein
VSVSRKLMILLRAIICSYQPCSTNWIFFTEQSVRGMLGVTLYLAAGSSI